MAKFLFKIWSANRLQKKTFMADATIETVIEKAHSHGLKGCVLVLEADGSKICDDESLQWYGEERTILMLLDNEEDWIPPQNLQRTSLIHDGTASDISLSVDQSNTTLQPVEISFENQITSPNSTTCSHSNISLDTTLSMSSSALSSRSSTYQEGHKLFETFQIPWEKIPSDILEMLDKKEKLGKKLNFFVNIIVDEMRRLSFYVPMNIIRLISQKIASKYPDSFIEKDDEGNILSTYPIALITTIKNRNNFLNRAPKRKTSNFEPNIPIKERRFATTLQRTCPNWQPEQNPEGQSMASVEFKKKTLQNNFQKEKLTSDEKETVSKYMNDCFALQRQYFNDRENIPTVQNIQENWPFIFDRNCLYDHFNQLMKLDAYEFKKTFENNKIKLISFTQQNKLNLNLNPSDSTTSEGIIKFITEYFNEDTNYLFKKFQFGTTLDQIHSGIPTNTPWFAIVDAASFEDQKAYIFMEGVITIKYDHFTFADLICQVICYFYVFNIIFPREISKTLEFIVRYYFKYYPETLRGKKKNINTLNKINNFIKKLNTI